MLKYEELPKVNSKRWLSPETLEGETWKDVPGYNGILQVSNYSRIMNTRKGRILRQTLNASGYYIVVLRENDKYKHLPVHRLVLLAFVPNTKNKPCADHIDTNRRNNTVGNLRWATSKENANNPITKQNRKQSHAHTMFSDKKVVKMDKGGRIIRVYGSVKEAAEDTGLNKCSISNAAHKRMMPNRCGQMFQCKTAGGYVWKYVKDIIGI